MKDILLGMRHFSVLHPVYYLYIVLSWMLGAGIAHYLGKQIRWVDLILGIIFYILVFTSAMIFSEFFRQKSNPRNPDEVDRKIKLSLNKILQYAYALLTLSGTICIMLILAGSIAIEDGVLMIVTAILLLAYAIPPFSLMRKGYGEILLPVFISALLPAASFHLQTSYFHKLLTIAVFPQILMGIAYFLAENFSTYAHDIRSSYQTMLMRISWERAVPLHHVLILGTYLLFSSSTFFGVSWAVIWPIFLSFPFAALQMIWLHRIANGRKPIWNFFVVLVRSVYGLTIYMVALPFWLRYPV